MGISAREQIQENTRINRLKRPAKLLVSGAMQSSAKNVDVNHEVSQLTVDGVLAFRETISELLDRANVTWFQFEGMCWLLKNGEVGMTALSQALEHTTAATTGLVDRLIELGYVKRARSKSDRRKVSVYLSRRGEAVMNEVFVFVAEGIPPNLTKKEGDVLRRIHSVIAERVHAGES